MYDDDRDALAAEYVLGTLSADERDQAEALLVIDPGFAEIVRVWERRLGELNVMVEAVEPPAEVWDKIKTEVDGTADARRSGSRDAPIEKRLPGNRGNRAAHRASDATDEITPEPAASEALPNCSGAELKLDAGAAARRIGRRRRSPHCCELAAAGAAPEAEQPSSAEPPRRLRRKSSAAPTCSIWRAKRSVGAASRWR